MLVCMQYDKNYNIPKILSHLEKRNVNTKKKIMLIKFIGRGWFKSISWLKHGLTIEILNGWWQAIFFSKGYEIDMLIYYFSILYSANVYNFVGYNFSNSFWK